MTSQSQTNPEFAAWPTGFVDFVRALTSPGSPNDASTVARYPDWQIRTIRDPVVLDDAVITPVGQPVRHPFNADAIAAALNNLSTARWLDQAVRLELVGIDCARFGLEFVRAHGDLGFEKTEFGIKASHLAEVLLLLRDGLRVTTYIATNDLANLQGLLDERVPRWQEVFSVLRSHGESRRDALLHTSRLAVFHLAQSHGPAVQKPQENDAIFRFAELPATPLELVWTCIAIGAGAVAPSVDIPGVYVCEHHRCGMVFVRAPRNLRGKHRFCSKSCGDRYHAYRSTTKKRQATKSTRKKS